MATKEIYNDLLPQNAFNTQLINTDTTTVGNIIDSYSFDLGILYVIQAGVVTAGDATPLFEESDDSAFATSNVVADANIVPVNIDGTLYETGQEAASILDASNEIKALGLIGGKRYKRLSIVSDNSANLTISASVLKAGNIKSVYGLA